MTVGSLETLESPLEEEEFSVFQVEKDRLHTQQDTEVHAVALRLSDPYMTLFAPVFSHTVFMLSYVLHCILLLFWNNAVCAQGSV